MRTIVVWFRRDLRLQDHPALYHARKAGEVIPVYVEQAGLGTAMRQWLAEQLAVLAKELPGLRIVRGRPERVLKQLVRQHRAEAVYYNRHYWPEEQALSKRVDAVVETQSFQGDLLLEPNELAPVGGSYYKIFTPFYRRALEVIEVAKPLAGRAGEANRRLGAFIKHIDHYADVHEFPAIKGTSELSPYLAVGAISPRKVWYATKPRKGAVPFLRQLMWREFAYHLLYHFPDLPTRPFKAEFARFPWRKDPEGLRRWQQGETGYPIVDAGMRQLAQTGWIHNRVRLVVASFLTKNLRIPWWEGEDWFWDKLIDADLAANAFNWQWVAGSGVDASPYFRIFNPVIQGKKFDPDGEYVRRWVPELEGVPDKIIHCPWVGDPINSYPAPIVDHKKAREAALKAYERMRRRT